MNSFTQPKKALSLSATLRKKAQSKLTNFFCQANTGSSQETDILVAKENEYTADNT